MRTTTIPLFTIIIQVRGDRSRITQHQVVRIFQYFESRMTRGVTNVILAAILVVTHSEIEHRTEALKEEKPGATTVVN